MLCFEYIHYLSLSLSLSLFLSSTYCYYQYFSSSLSLYSFPSLPFKPSRLSLSYYFPLLSLFYLFSSPSSPSVCVLLNPLCRRGSPGKAIKGRPSVAPSPARRTGASAQWSHFSRGKGREVFPFLIKIWEDRKRTSESEREEKRREKGNISRYCHRRPPPFLIL